MPQIREIPRGSGIKLPGKYFALKTADSICGLFSKQGIRRLLKR